MSPAQEQRRGSSRDEQAADLGAPLVASRDGSLDADVDSMLDDIDAVLDSNAEEFVRGFVQKGGQ